MPVWRVLPHPPKGVRGNGARPPGGGTGGTETLAPRAAGNVIGSAGRPRSGEDGANWLRRFMSRIEDMAHGYPSRSERLK